MRLAAAIYSLVMKTGGIGLLVLGILDSSFLFAPWGNDLMTIALVAQHPSVGRMLYYALMSTAGSVGGCLLLDLVCRPLGEKGLEKHLSRRRFQSVQRKVGKNAGRAVAVASLAPPPFPFTAVVMAASALQYSRRRLLTLVGVCRGVRFVVVGILALRFGKSILQWSKSPVLQGVLIGLIVVCTVGSVISVYGWLTRR
ncbi:MAG: VTT domain-containing protein [Candidatus Solibacter sp.]